MLQGRKILLGVTGSISAYKSVYLLRLLTQKGANVRVVMTPSATTFVSAITFSTLSKNPASVNLIKDEETGEWENHVELGNWADLFLIAPCSANSIGKMVTGVADNLLITTWLSAKCPVMIAPAMDHDMFHHFSTQENLALLKSKGVEIINPGKGELASGIIGDGRLAEPDEIVERVEAFFFNKSFSGKFIGKNIIVTAGPTYEEIDPVRFIGNHSSGKMGYAIAIALVNAGANVSLISGPTQLSIPEGLSSFDKIVSANEMHIAVDAKFSNSDIVIMAAAVADYRPVTRANNKIKKGDEGMSLELEKTVDILKALGKTKSKQFLVGFALETNNEISNAQKKLTEKNLDMIVLNSLQDQGAGFGHDTNKITIFDKHNKMFNFELESKAQTANNILHAIAQNI
jgi:phosphopantothenoylcysteine decarboxylase/phosphopantothenate--cysteine ligase